MIATIRGEISQIEDNAVIIELGGFGIRVFVPTPLKDRMEVNEQTLLYTHLAVREDSWNLYGFETKSDRDLFILLLGTDGVGPRTAMAVMSATTMELIHKAVFADTPDLLGRIPGIGRKTAQKLVLHLKDRLKPINNFDQIAAISDADSEVLAALSTLGYSVIEAQTAIQSIPEDAPDDVEERLRIALQQFNSK